MLKKLEGFFTNHKWAAVGILSLLVFLVYWLMSRKSSGGGGILSAGGLSGGGGVGGQIGGGTGNPGGSGGSNDQQASLIATAFNTLKDQMKTMSDQNKAQATAFSAQTKTLSDSMSAQGTAFANQLSGFMSQSNQQRQADLATAAAQNQQQSSWFSSAIEGFKGMFTAQAASNASLVSGLNNRISDVINLNNQHRNTPEPNYQYTIPEKSSSGKSQGITYYQGDGHGSTSPAGQNNFVSAHDYSVQPAQQSAEKTAQAYRNARGLN